MTRPLLALYLLLSCVATAGSSTVTFALDQPFTLAFGDTATGPKGLTIWFNGSGPHFIVKVNGVEREPLWAKSPGGGPKQRGRLDDLFITVEAMPDDEQAKLQVTRAKPGTLAWGRPHDLRWCDFVSDPDGSTWWVDGVDEWKGEATIRVRRLARGESSTTWGASLVMKKGRGEERDGDFVVSAELSAPLASSTGVRLTVRRPSAERKLLTFGKPVTLIPDESAVGEGLTLTLRGYGHKRLMEGGDLAFTEIDLKAGSEQQTLRFLHEKPIAPNIWRGYQLSMTACDDHGPPHSSMASSTFVVIKAPPGSEDD